MIFYALQSVLPRTQGATNNRKMIGESKVKIEKKKMQHLVVAANICILAVLTGKPS